MTPEDVSPEQRIKPLLTNLLYPSESDESVEWVTCYLKSEGPLTVSQVKSWLMLPPALYVEERPEAEFWEPVVDAQAYGADDEARTAQFKQLQEAVQTLTNRQLFRVGDTEIDVYLLGQLPDGSRAGLKTKVVET